MRREAVQRPQVIHPGLRPGPGWSFLWFFNFPGYAGERLVHVDDSIPFRTLPP